jgi:glycerol uptake facilitator-like aquaporin
VRRRLIAEGLGTGLLLYVIVGSGIAAQNLGADGVTQLLAHALVIGIGLGVLILLFQSVSGSHFNPSVTLAFWRSGSIDGTTGLGYLAAQLAGALAGVGAANLTYGQQIYSVSATARDGLGLITAEGIATFVLVLVILALVRVGRAPAIPAAVGGWVAAIVFATASTGFANPAVTISRVFTDTYTGIAPGSVWGFLAAQIVAGLAAVPVAGLLFETKATQQASA